MVSLCLGCQSHLLQLARFARHSLHVVLTFRFKVCLFSCHCYLYIHVAFDVPGSTNIEEVTPLSSVVWTPYDTDAVESMYGHADEHKPFQWMDRPDGNVLSVGSFIPGSLDKGGEGNPLGSSFLVTRAIKEAAAVQGYDVIVKSSSGNEVTLRCTLHKKEVSSTNPLHIPPGSLNLPREVLERGTSVEQRTPEWWALRQGRVSASKVPLPNPIGAPSDCSCCALVSVHRNKYALT